jgi:hypothetical protein
MNNPKFDNKIRTHIKEEIEEADKGIIKKLKTRKAPARDGITNKTIKNQNDEAMKKITNIKNAIIKQEHYSETWKKSKTIMIPKPRKSTKETKNYQPISLLPSISKITENNLQNTEARNRRKRNTYYPTNNLDLERNIQLMKVINHVEREQKKGKKTGGIFLDIAKAFVCHEGLIYKMMRRKISKKMTRIIKSYMENRKFTVMINEEESEEKEAEAGVPQGSILGPTLYLIYTSDIPKSTNTTATYADDTLILAMHIKNTTGSTKTQHARKMDGKMEDQSKSGQKQRNNFLQKEDQNERKANGQHQNEHDKNPMDEKHEILRSHTGRKFQLQRPHQKHRRQGKKNQQLTTCIHY